MIKTGVSYVTNSDVFFDFSYVPASLLFHVSAVSNISVKNNIYSLAYFSTVTYYTNISTKILCCELLFVQLFFWSPCDFVIFIATFSDIYLRNNLSDLNSYLGINYYTVLTEVSYKVFYC